MADIPDTWEDCAECHGTGEEQGVAHDAPCPTCAQKTIAALRARVAEQEAAYEWRPTSGVMTALDIMGWDRDHWKREAVAARARVAEAEAKTPRHLHIAIGNAQRAIDADDWHCLSTVNEDIQGLVDAAVSRIKALLARVAEVEREAADAHAELDEVYGELAPREVDCEDGTIRRLTLVERLRDGFSVDTAEWTHQEEERDSARAWAKRWKAAAKQQRETARDLACAGQRWMEAQARLARVEAAARDAIGVAEALTEEIDTARQRKPGMQVNSLGPLDQVPASALIHLRRQFARIGKVLAAALGGEGRVDANVRTTC